MLNGGYLGSLWMTKKLSLTSAPPLVGRGDFEPPASASRTLIRGFSRTEEMSEKWL